MRHARAGALLLAIPILAACPKKRPPEVTEPPACDPSKHRCVISKSLSTLVLEPGEDATDHTIEHGVHGDDEMCVFALFADTGMAWDAEVPQDRGRRVGTRKDGTTAYTGPCEITGVPWIENKPGGQPRPPSSG